MIVEDNELTTGSIEENKESLGKIEGDKRKNTIAHPNHKLPFMAIFSHLPKNLNEYSVEIISADKVE